MSGPDMSSLVGVVDFSSVVEVVFFVAVALVGVYVINRAVEMVTSAVRGESVSKEDREAAWREYNEASRLSDEDRKRWEN